jgi:hypothetical protein
MESLWFAVLYICGGTGIIASLVVAFCPCWVLVNSQTKWRRILWKFLAVSALWGWMALFVAISQRFKFGDFGAWLGLVVTGSLIYTAAIRGEQVARLQGRIKGQQEDREGVRYVSK